MFEFKKLCDAYENLSTVEKGFLLTEKSIVINQKLECLSLPGIEPFTTLAGFILGSIVADGKVNEQEYLLMYPALVQVFGTNFDFTSVKEAFRRDSDSHKIITAYTRDMIRILDFLDEELKNDMITLCLCVVAIDGKISLKEKKYIRCLCNA